jgi:L-alanine-DL-glutamate epimerase-like enolase superfamily enzyme
MAAVRNFLAQEWDGASEEIFAALTKGTLPKQAQGGVLLPSKPGLGIEMDWELLAARYPYQGRRVTPQITPRPQ